jgi:cytochrome c-type biogenesis protein CcmH/NrfG
VIFTTTRRIVLAAAFLACCLIAVSVNEVILYQAWLAEEQSKQPMREKVQKILAEHKRRQREKSRPVQLKNFPFFHPMA